MSINPKPYLLHKAQNHPSNEHIYRRVCMKASCDLQRNRTSNWPSTPIDLSEPTAFFHQICHQISQLLYKLTSTGSIYKEQQSRHKIELCREKCVCVCGMYTGWMHTASFEGDLHFSIATDNNSMACKQVKIRRCASTRNGCWFCN